MTSIYKSKSDIKQAIIKYYSRNKSICAKDFHSKNNLPSIYIVFKFFGSLSNALKECDIPLSITFLTNDELLNSLKTETVNHLRQNIFLMNSEEIDKNSNLQSILTYQRRFGTLSDIYKQINYDYDEYNKEALEKDMLKKYFDACDKYRQVLNSREITELNRINPSEIYSTESYTSHFGKLSEVQKLCGFQPTKLGMSITKEEAINCLLKLNNELGRVPTSRDVYVCDYTPCSGYYIINFGSWNNALKAAELSVTKKLVDSNGIVCNSTYEYKFLCMLNKYKIMFNKEVPYSNVIVGFKKRYKFDFEVLINNRRYYVEIFGIENNESYDIRKEEKINLCKIHDIPLIEIYSKDILNNNYESLYECLIDKINQILLLKVGVINQWRSCLK